ncbi:uncharacterized protein LOC127259447 [Andrographis paniculata]|uniref:uncharacterized protein LOC127259447 n=1 Tax=Andrographis paniculata TaxID=175694 RepID=UPI0021E76BF7|nr:uncharacterized protein LOC127259447 [Andrographis paniculata]
MVSKRQKLAKKRYKEEHPELFPNPEPTPPKDPNKKKKKKKNSKFKRTKADGSDSNKPKKSSHKKHPLRVAGMKPGESCFICKAPDHIAKNCPKKSEWERNKICLFCRQRGHSLKRCPNKNEEPMDKKLCYNCGEMGHSLSQCLQPLQDGGTKYAQCFICNETGHLSKNCPKNTHGIYPKGGSCKICGGVTHLARDCPNKGISNFNSGDVPVPQRLNRVTKFASGDDLDDDFTPAVPVDDEDKDSKAKKKQGPKVVNFVSYCLEGVMVSGLANSASGVAVVDDCKLKFLELKAKRNYRYIIYKIKDQNVVPDKLGQPGDSYDDFTASLPSDECRFAVFDFDFTTTENCQKSKIFFIAWSPETSPVRMKMVYASSKDRFKRELDGIQVELQATDPSEMSFDIIKERAI